MKVHRKLTYNKTMVKASKAAQKNSGNSSVTDSNKENQMTEKNASVYRENDNISDLFSGAESLIENVVTQNEKTLTAKSSVEADDDMEEASLPDNIREQRRLSRRPSIEHLEDGTVTLEDGLVLPLFAAGDRIVVERFLSWSLNYWLDTKVYKVREIDDDSGVVKCIDEEHGTLANIGFKHPGQNVKLVPGRGDPFNPAKARKELAAKQKAQFNKDNGIVEKKRGRGRPPGSKNRPKEIIKAEKTERNKIRAAKRR
jgi:hypothetical protein